MVERQNVVLVTGAGASCPYGFPSGEELTQQIIEGLRQLNSPMAVAVRLAVPGCEDLRGLARRLEASERTSIDAFLQPECNADLREAARAAMAWVLLSREPQICRPSKEVGGDWMRNLFNALLDDARQPDDLECNKVTVITFNFDCYLEHRWRAVLAENFPLSDADLKRVAYNSLRVLHVNGSLQPGRCQGEDGARDRVFGDGNVDPWYLKYYAPHLLFFHDEQRSIRHVIEQALSRADVIAFLGFSFQTSNVRRLGLPSVLDRKDGSFPALYASGKGLSTAERAAAAERVRADLHVQLRFAADNDDCLATLRRFSILKF